MTQQPQQDRRHKPTSSRLQEYATYATLAGIAGILLQIGEFKANFKNLCEKVMHIELIQSTYAEENRIEHAAIKDDLSETKINIAAIRGRQSVRP
jgi:hypothetical protein